MIASHNFGLQVAKQTARGVYPVAPSYFLEVVSGGLSSKPNMDTLNLGDNRMFGTSKKRIGYIETGGTVTITAQPKAMGAILAWCFGVDTPAGGGDPYTHVITPATSFSGFPFLTFWNTLDGEWSQFRDCQIVGVDIECGVDNRWMRLVLTVIGMAKEKKVAAPGSPATEEVDLVHWLDAGGYHVLNGDYVNMLHGTVPTDLATMKTWLHTFKDAWNAHCAIATGRHHKAADAVNVLAYADSPADEAACIADVALIKTAINAHIVLTTTHYFADPSANLITYGVAADTAACLLCAQEIQGKVNSPGAYGRHLGATAGIRSVKLSFQMNATPLQGEDMTAYAVQRKPGTVMIATELLQEDFRIINLAKYGDPAAAAESEVTTEITQCGFYTKFIASTSGAERSIAILVPQYDLDPEPMMTMTGDPEGGEVVLTVGGEATGSAPIVTATVLNSVATY